MTSYSFHPSFNFNLTNSLTTFPLGFLSMRPFLVDSPKYNFTTLFSSSANNFNLTVPKAALPKSINVVCLLIFFIDFKGLIFFSTKYLLVKCSFSSSPVLNF